MWLAIPSSSDFAFTSPHRFFPAHEEPNMMIIGVDYHPCFQQIAFLLEETGEYDEQRLNHEGGELHRGT